MHSISNLRRQAIVAAKQGAWQEAVDLNRGILEIDHEDVSAMNRLGLAFMQLKDLKQAKQVFGDVLEVDKSNVIAKKHLAALKENRVGSAPTFSARNFIEEPGRTKTVELHRLAGKTLLCALSVGQECQLKPKNRFISVESNGQYIGALPEDLSFRLAKLMQTGNTYSCAIYSCSEKTCKVYLKEETKSKKNQGTHSFPPSKLALNSVNDIDERYLLDDNIAFDDAEPESDDAKIGDDTDDGYIE